MATVADCAPPTAAAAARPAPAGQAPGYTVESLAAELTALGVVPGDVLLVQAGLRSVGRVAGGAEAVVRALLAALGGVARGTLVGYTATPENSDTSRLAALLTDGLGPAELAAHRAAMPAFDPRGTPASPTMGALAEQIRTTPGALRSNHPQTSFAAVGRLARTVTATHELDCHLGESSPLGRLHELGAKVLMLGVPLAGCTAFHLADLRMPDPPVKRYGCVVRGGRGNAEWIHFEAPDLDDRHFAALGEDVLREAPGLRQGRVGDADAVLVPVPEAVAAAHRGLVRRRGAAEV
ncbi:aminoglycoside N(3)-acetyltransferase [Kitasatospora sp. NBC_00315]|uniref:aminoglycoside N(3)-acetyltransferase n=1 Tax=Kitasatospora sp. NBC_00315 TaxID=2975963 RepID=UPI0032533D35